MKLSIHLFDQGCLKREVGVQNYPQGSTAPLNGSFPSVDFIKEKLTGRERRVQLT
jgi:hypothetical protein